MRIVNLSLEKDDYVPVDIGWTWGVRQGQWAYMVADVFFSGDDDKIRHADEFLSEIDAMVQADEISKDDLRHEPEAFVIPYRDGVAGILFLFKYENNGNTIRIFAGDRSYDWC